VGRHHRHVDVARPGLLEDLLGGATLGQFPDDLEAALSQPPAQLLEVAARLHPANLPVQRVGRPAGVLHRFENVEERHAGAERVRQTRRVGEDTLAELGAVQADEKMSEGLDGFPKGRSRPVGGVNLDRTWRAGIVRFAPLVHAQGLPSTSGPPDIQDVPTPRGRP
jgi:hypothetical protein